MNVCRFINSKDIREHLETIKYPFGSLEAAWIIYQCRFASLEEKHAAWRELIQTMPDCAIEERPNTEAHDSLHRFLAAYMERETKLLHTFFENDGGIYRWMECQEDGERLEHPGIYSDYAKCYDRISREISDNEDGEIAGYLVTKTYPDAEEPCMQSKLSAEGELLSVRESQAGPDPFEGLFFVFPTPFQKGDIVWEPNTQGYCKGPFVLTGVSGEAEAPGHRRGGGFAVFVACLAPHAPVGSRQVAHRAVARAVGVARAAQSHFLARFGVLRPQGGDAPSVHLHARHTAVEVQRDARFGLHGL